MEKEVGSLIKRAKLKRCGSDTYPVLSMTMHEGLVFQNDRFKKQIASIDQSQYQVVYRHQLVESFPIDEGVLAVQELTEAGIVSPAYKIWDIDMNLVVPKYLEYALRAPRSIEYYKLKLRGTTARRRSISDFELCSMKIICPSLDEQQRIVAIIEKVQKVIIHKQKEVTVLDNLIQARFVEMFGDLTNPECLWDKYQLVEVCANKDDIKCGPFGTQLNKDEYTEDGIAVWEIPQINVAFESKPLHFITEKKAEQLKAYTIIPGDIAMSRKGNVGKCAVFPREYPQGIIHSDVLRIRVNSQLVHPIFMMYQFHFSEFVTRQIELVSSGAIMAGVNVTKLKHIYVHVPPLELQTQFATFVQAIDKYKLKVEDSLKKLEVLQKSLMQQYFG